MNNLTSLEIFFIKQTCRFFAYKFQAYPNDFHEDPSKYSVKFLKMLHDFPNENIMNIFTETIQSKNPNCIERKELLAFLTKVNDLRSKSARFWTDLQHYLCFVYRHCISSGPDPEQKILSSNFIAEMKHIVKILVDEDDVQLCLRLFSVIREYTVLAHKQHQKISSLEESIESLFYYYEAFLSATKNICQIFSDLEGLIINTYKLGWLDLNTSIFMYYFYETSHVQNLIREFDKVKDKMPMKATGIYTILTELHKLWRHQMLGINGVIANKLGVKFKGLEQEMMLAHKQILSKNIWLDRSSEERSKQDKQIFDCQLFSLVGNKNLVLPEGTLDPESLNCICEDCIILKYKYFIDNRENCISSGSTTVSCRFCKQYVALNHFQQHTNARGTECKIRFDSTLLEFTDRNKAISPKYCLPVKQGDSQSEARAENESNRSKPYEKCPCEKENYNKCDPNKPRENPVTQKPILKKCEGKNGVKDTKSNSSCSHRCKLQDEVKSEFRKANQDTCDHHRESKKCDCTFCEVFGPTSSHTHKTNETRNRLRTRLNQRNGEITKKIVKNNPTKLDSGPGIPKIPIIENTAIEPTSEKLVNDIHGLLNFIEGNTNLDKLGTAEKKAAKKARQRNKKEEERLRIIEEERKKIEEEERKAKEILRNEQIARQLAEDALKKDAKKKKSKKKNNAASNNSKALFEDIPAMVTIKRVIENNSSTIKITLKGSSADQDKILSTLVSNECIDFQPNLTKKGAKNKQEVSAKILNVELNSNSNKKKKEPPRKTSTINTELRVTLAVDTAENKPEDKRNKPLNNCDVEKNKKIPNKKEKKSKDEDINIPMLRLPPGITITKVDRPMADRNYKISTVDNSYNTNTPLSKSGVIVVDTEKLIKESNSTNSAPSSKKSKKRRKKPSELQNNVGKNKPSMVTLKNPIFQNMQNKGDSVEIMPDLEKGQCQQAAIFRNENGMVTIRSSRLHQSLSSASLMPNMSELKPVLGPEVPTTYMTSTSFAESTRISPFNAQEILSGLPGIEITKVEKNNVKAEVDTKKSTNTAEVSIIPASNADKFIFDKDDLHYDNVFTPRDILEDDLDADERELEAFKRFCQQSVPPKRKEKVAHLNVKDIVLKKPTDKVS